MAGEPLLTIHTDGASRGNPGAAAFAYVIQRPGQPPVEQAGCLGDLTNNQAEYTALVRALEEAAKLGNNHRLTVLSDSELMVKQMRGEYRVKNEDLRPLYEKARCLAGQFAGVEYRHVRREQNKRADELCNLALDGKWIPESGAEQPLPRFDLHAEVEACLDLGGAENPARLWREVQLILKRHGVTLPGRG